MHKRWLGLSSIAMAGMLTVSSLSATTMQAYATEPGALDEAVASASEASSQEEGVEESEEKEISEKQEDVEKEEESEKQEDAQKNVDSEKKETAEESEKESQEPEVLGESKEKSEEEASKEVTEQPKEETAEKTEEAPVNGLVFFNRWNKSQTVSSKLSFDQQYQEFCYDLGNSYNTANVQEIRIKVSDQANNVCIKLYDADMNEKMANYSCNGSSEYVITPNYDGTVAYIGVMSMASDESVYPYGITIDAVDVKASENNTEANEELLVLTGDDLKFTEAWEGTAVEGNVLEFDKEWREYRLAFGRTIAGGDIKSIKVTFAEPNSQSIAFKAYGDGKELKADYGKKGSKSYVFYPGVTSDVDGIGIMAMADQAYTFNCEVESVEVLIDTTPAEERPKAEVEEDIVDLRNPVAEVMGDDFIIGTALSYDEFADELDIKLATKHFNGVTLGNELKPDAMIKKGAEIKTVELNGQQFDFPELDFSLPESRLDVFVKWNEEHPDKQIKIRGHVLVWHSQTPEFFFHEDYDVSKPLVSPEVMNLRLEYYIKSVAEHFTADGSKYAGMFYGWDVVNEAVSDSTGTYRNASENSMWWRVYNSPEFIQNAFVYANRYMPADVALFYNDYNETMSGKIGGICQLLRDVKATPGARIDGMGMQAHYQIAENSPSMEQFKAAAEAYAEIVDQIQVTELDFKGATSATDERLAVRYKAVYDTIRRLRDQGINFTGMTIWGVTDKHSWLQSSNNNGGGADGSAKQYPLLFDDYYKAKNCFWALTDTGELEPEIKSVTLVQNVDNDFSAGNSYGFEGCTFIPMWGEDSIDVKVTVKDNTVNDNDHFIVYVDNGNGIQSNSGYRYAVDSDENGYSSIVSIPVSKEDLFSNQIKIDVIYVDDETAYAFNDTTFKHEESSKYFADTVIKPLVTVKKGTPAIDGQFDDAVWATAQEIPLTINVGSKVSATAKVLWDEENLYVLADIEDSVLNKASSDDYQQDSLEIFIDENNHKSTTYEDDDKQYRVNYENKHSFNGKKCLEENFNSEVVLTENGYKLEAAFKWTDITPQIGDKVGFELQVNDADDSGKRIGTLSWADKTGNGWSSPSVFGTVLLAEGEEIVVEPTLKLFTKYGRTYCVTEDGEKLTGFQTVDGTKYYFDNNGVMKKRVMVTVDGKKYYAKADGSIAISEKVNHYASDYIFDENGVMITGLVEYDGQLYYCKTDGKVAKKVMVSDGEDKYFASEDGTLVKNTMVSRYGSYYIFGNDCKMVTGFVTFNGEDYYCKANGKVAKNYMFTVDGKTYYAKADGTLAKNETITRYFKKYTFDENGVLIATGK